MSDKEKVKPKNGRIMRPDQVVAATREANNVTVHLMDGREIVLVFENLEEANQYLDHLLGIVRRFLSNQPEFQ